MNFTYSETQTMIADSARAFAQKYIKPYFMEWDEQQKAPIDLFKKAADYGFMGILIPESYGGAGLSYHEYVAMIVEITKVDPSIGLSIAAHNSLCSNHIYLFGNQEQKEKWLPSLAKGKFLGAWGLTEYNSGSDAAALGTVAVRQGDKWVINGSKTFITHGKTGDIMVCIARTGEANTKNNATAFAIERGTKGFLSGKKENKLGMRASETAEVIFEQCEVPDANRIGQVGEGFKQAMEVLDGGRISIAALSLGISKGAYEAALSYSKTREQFGKPIGKFQAIAFKLADMATEIETSELLIHKAAYLKSCGEKTTKIGSMAKLHASEACVRIANEALQIHGGYGYIKDFPVEKFYRDAKLCTIGEGTSEIQRIVISRHL